MPSSAFSVLHRSEGASESSAGEERLRFLGGENLALDTGVPAFSVRDPVEEDKEEGRSASSFDALHGGIRFKDADVKDASLPALLVDDDDAAAEGKRSLTNWQLCREGLMVVKPMMVCTV